MQHRSNYIPSRVLLDDLLRVADRLRKNRLSQTDYSHLGVYSFITICRRFGSWRSALQQLSLQPMQYKNTSAASLLQDIHDVAERLQNPRMFQKEYLANGKFSRKIIYRLFGCWHAAAVAAGLEPIRPFRPRLSRGPRTINVSLRFQILRQDRFRCRACGRSPATHPEVELEVDHIVPWSRGGSSRSENLQTLCNRCNRGKADSV